MKRVSVIFLMFALSIVLAACGTGDTDDANKNSGATDEGENQVEEQAEELTIKHELDSTTVKKNPEKVVVFDFGSLDTLNELGVEVTALPQTNIPSYLSQYEDEKYTNVGSLKEPDFEKINEIQPDLIIISGRQRDLYDELKKIAPTIYLGVDTENYMESFKSNAKIIGEIFGKEDEVESKITAIEESIQSLHDQASALDETSLIILANEGKASAYGPHSRFGIIHDVFGFAPVDDTIEVSTHGQSISFEYIVEKNPDYLFVIDRSAAIGGEVEANEMIENELVEKTNAYKNGNIIYLDPDFWYLSGGGLESVAAMVKEVEGALK